MAIDRVRGRALQRINARILSDNPLCVMCQARGKVSIATEVDHIIALVNGGLDDGDKQGLCHACHADKTAADLGHRVRQAVGLDGWPL